MGFVGLHGMDRVHFFAATPGTRYDTRQITPGTQEIEVITDGGAVFVQGGVEYPVGPGSMLWFYPGETIVAVADRVKPYQTCVLRFLVSQPPPQRPLFHSVWANVGECLDFCRTLLRRYHLGEYPPEVFAECLYTRLYWEAEEFRRRHRLAILPSVQRALDCIEEHFAEPLSVARIARAAGVSPPHLHALFREQVGVSPKQAVLRLRLRKAESLLSLTALSVKEVAQEAGFGDASGFCAAFRRVTGTTPMAYRKGRAGG